MISIWKANNISANNIIPKAYLQTFHITRRLCGSCYCRVCLLRHVFIMYYIMITFMYTTRVHIHCNKFASQEGRFERRLIYRFVSPLFHKEFDLQRGCLYLYVQRGCSTKSFFIFALNNLNIKRVNYLFRIIMTLFISGNIVHKNY